MGLNRIFMCVPNQALWRRAMAPLVVLLAATSAIDAFAQSEGGSGGPPPSPVYVDAVREQTVTERRMVTGELRAARRSQVAAQEPGLVIDFPVREGQRVRKGEALAQLDATQLEIELRQVHADLEVAQAVVDERQAQLNQAERDLSLIRQSFERNAANEKELHDAESAAAVARARVQQAKRQIAQISASEDLLRERVKDLKITAPFDGVVVSRHTELGEWLGEGQAVVGLVSIQKPEAWLDVPQDYHHAIVGRDATVQVRIDATGAVLTTTENRIIPLVDHQARTFRLVSVLENKDNTLTPGMSVTAWVPTGEESQSLTVSKNAVLRSDMGPYVFVARDMGDGGPLQAVMANIEVRFPIGDRYVIRSRDLKSGDRAIVEGNERLFPHAPIKPMPIEQLTQGAETSSPERPQ